ncbi:MAG TPA: T9SS type A sorting domain-containing protein, partial [Paludibacter sp.]|nr:T9SS type A sorting domain-containing protein [Paludibacter sp.]
SQDIKYCVNIEGNNIYLQFEDSNTNLTIYNISGQQAYSQLINSQSIAIQLPKGIYFLTVNNKSIKFII